MAVTLSTYALTDLDKAKSYRLAQGEELNTTPEQVDLLKNLINVYSTMFEKYCDRLFKSRTHTEYHDGEGRDFLMAKEYPIVSITSIYDDSAWAWGEDTLIDSSSYRFSERLIVLSQSATCFGNYRQNVKLTYVAGYTTIPYDLEHSCISEVIKSFDNITSLGLDSASFGDVSESFTPAAFLPQTKTVLNNYKRREVL